MCELICLVWDCNYQPRHWANAEQRMKVTCPSASVSITPKSCL